MDRTKPERSGGAEHRQPNDATNARISCILGGFRGSPPCREDLVPGWRPPAMTLAQSTPSPASRITSLMGISADDLVELARRKSSADRGELFGNITDLFLKENTRL